MYSKKYSSGFTLVELVVVLTIVAILSTFGFVAYVDYLKSVRDSVRIQQMTSLHDSAILYGTQTKIPVSSDGISILSGSGRIGYQGYIRPEFRDTIKYTDGGVDPKTKRDYTYFVSGDRKSIQILGFFEENTNYNIAFTPEATASNVDYSILYPRVVGERLGVIIESETQIPIQDYGQNMDILTATGQYISLITDNEILTGSGTSLVGMIPGSSCKKILDTLGTVESGTYKINPEGKGQFDVYCDMIADGGGWTFGGYISSNASNTDVYFNSSIGLYDPSRDAASDSYFIDISHLYHTEMLLLFSTPDILAAESADNMLKLRYDILTPGLYMGPLVLPNENTFFGGGDGLYYSTRFSGPETYTQRSQFGSSGWGIGTIGNTIPYIVRISTSQQGVYKYDEVWGGPNTSTSGNSVWVYVR